MKGCLLPLGDSALVISDKMPSASSIDYTMKMSPFGCISPAFLMCPRTEREHEMGNQNEETQASRILRMEFYIKAWREV